MVSASVPVDLYREQDEARGIAPESASLRILSPSSENGIGVGNECHHSSLVQSHVYLEVGYDILGFQKVLLKSFHTDLSQAFIIRTLYIIIGTMK